MQNSLGSAKFTGGLQNSLGIQNSPGMQNDHNQDTREIVACRLACTTSQNAGHCGASLSETRSDFCLCNKICKGDSAVRTVTQKEMQSQLAI